MAVHINAIMLRLTRVPSSVMTLPLTRTRPATISSSQRRLRGHAGLRQHLLQPLTYHLISGHTWHLGQRFACHIYLQHPHGPSGEGAVRALSMRR